MGAAEQAVEAEVQSSVRDDLMAAFKEHSEEAEAPEDKSAPARDESGRFAAKDPKDDAEQAGRADPVVDKSRGPAGKSAPADAEGASSVPAAIGTATPAGATQPAGAGASTVSPDVTAAPQAWSLAAKAKWAELPAEIRSEINRRETDMHKGMTRMDDERQFARAMHQAVQPYEAIMRSEGLNAPSYVGNVLNVAYTLRTADPLTKARTLASLAQTFGVDMNLLGPSQQQTSDPVVAALQQEVAQMRSASQQQQEQARQEAADRAQQEQQKIEQAISAFASDPKHPHFPSVMTHMGALMQGGQAKDMEEAYQMATWARPDIRAQIQAAEVANQQAEAAKRQRAQVARTKGASVRGGPGGSPQATPNPNASVREDLEAAIAEARGRV
jgi:hypothetical protein